MIYENGASGVGYARCCSCETRAVAKPRWSWPASYRPLVANEVICARLQGLLRVRGVAVNAPQGDVGRVYDSSRCPGVVKCFVMADVGEHCRIGPTAVIGSDAPWPSWLSTFDRWVGRLDGNGETNLLLVAGRVVPVDWALTFPWAASGPRNLIRAVNDTHSMPIHADVALAAKRDAVEALREIDDDAIWTAVIEDVSEDLLPASTATAYWSGLCLRRDLLIAEVQK